MNKPASTFPRTIQKAHQAERRAVRTRTANGDVATKNRPPNTLVKKTIE